jgi:hypothetical protein
LYIVKNCSPRHRHGLGVVVKRVYCRLANNPVLESMKKYLLSAAASFILAACSHVVDGSVQKMRVETPGARNALCHIESDTWRYTVRPPQTVHISKSPDILAVNCMAAGGRNKTVMVKPSVEESVLLNGITGILPGLWFDHESGAMYIYPERVLVDFTEVAVAPPSMPQHHAPDLPAPRQSGLEEFRPGHPAMSRDKYAPAIPAPRRMPEPQAYRSDTLPGVSYGARLNAVPPASGANMDAAYQPPPSPPQFRQPAEPAAAPAMAGQGTSTGDLMRQYNPGVFGGGANAPAPSPAQIEPFAGGDTQEMRTPRSPRSPSLPVLRDGSPAASAAPVHLFRE